MGDGSQSRTAASMNSGSAPGKTAAGGDNVHLYVAAKRLAGIIRSLKEQIANEMKIYQEASADNRQLEVDIQQFQKRLKALEVLCINCEAHNAEMELRKKRYSEQLTKISKLVSEQNFDAANWAIILDEMAFVNRELFEILMSTAVAERRALHVVAAEEEKYRLVAEKLIQKRMELRKELHSEMDSYESLRAQIKSTESNLSHLRKAIDVYDAEYWQLDDARHDLQSQLFQLQELLRHTSRRRRFTSVSDSSSPRDDDDDSKGDQSSESSAMMMPPRLPRAAPERKTSQEAPLVKPIDKGQKITVAIRKGPVKSKPRPISVPAVRRHPKKSKELDKKSHVEPAAQPDSGGEYGLETYGPLQLGPPVPEVETAGQPDTGGEYGLETFGPMPTAPPVPLAINSPESKSTETGREESSVLTLTRDSKSDSTEEAESSSSGTEVRSDYAWKKSPEKQKSPGSSPSSDASYFLVEPHKLPFDPASPRDKRKPQKPTEVRSSSSSLESFKTTSSQVFSTQPQQQKPESTKCPKLQKFPTILIVPEHDSAESTAIGTSGGPKPGGAKTTPEEIALKTIPAAPAKVIRAATPTVGPAKHKKSSTEVKKSSTEVKKSSTEVKKSSTEVKKSSTEVTKSSTEVLKTAEEKEKDKTEKDDKKKKKGQEKGKGGDTPDEETVTDLRSSERESPTEQPKTSPISEDDVTDLRSESTSVADASDASLSGTGSCSPCNEMTMGQGKQAPVVYARGDLEYQSDRHNLKKEKQSVPPIQKESEPRYPIQGREYLPKTVAGPKMVDSKDIEYQSEQSKRRTQDKEYKPMLLIQKGVKPQEKGYQSKITAQQECQKGDKTGAQIQMPGKKFGKSGYQRDESSSSEQSPSSVPLSEPSASSDVSSYFVVPSYLSETRGITKTGVRETPRTSGVRQEEEISSFAQKKGPVEYIPTPTDQASLQSDSSPDRESSKRNVSTWSQRGCATPPNDDDSVSCGVRGSDTDVEFPGKGLFPLQNQEPLKRQAYSRLQLEEDTARGQQRSSSAILSTSSSSTTKSSSSQMQPAGARLEESSPGNPSSSSQEQSAELWEEISERTFLRDIAHHF